MTTVTDRLPAAWRTRGRTAAAATTASVVVMWVLEILDTVLHHRLDQLGLMSWDLGDLWSLVTAPFIHFGFGHLVANTVPFLVLGFLIALAGLARWLKVTGLAMLLSGLFAFFINPPHVLTAGASGIVFAYITYLITRGIVSRRWWQLLVGVVVLAAYGSVLWGVLPMQAGVSWQGHLGGAVAGVLAAWLLDRGPAGRRTVI